jgi:hypothetical protein
MLCHLRVFLHCKLHFHNHVNCSVLNALASSVKELILALPEAEYLISITEKSFHEFPSRKSNPVKYTSI